MSGFQAYLKSLAELSGAYFRNLHAILDTDDLNSLATLDAVCQVDISGPYANEQYKQKFKLLRLDLTMWSTINQIHTVVEMINIVVSFTKYHDRVGLFEDFIQFANNLLHQEMGGIKSFYRLNALLCRYYAGVYNKTMKQNEGESEALINKYSAQLEFYVWNSFNEFYHPVSELEKARNLYNRFRFRVVDSLQDKRVEDLVSR